MEGFAHLHVRSGFSYGFRVATPEELVKATREIGMGSMALTSPPFRTLSPIRRAPGLFSMD